jgi:hypothetical protein
MGKMEGSCSAGQSPQWAVVPVEEEEEEEEEEEVVVVVVVVVRRSALVTSERLLKLINICGHCVTS